MPAPYATTADVQARYPSEAALLCANETTRAPEWPRFDAALFDVSTEIRIMLRAAYTPSQLDDLDAESLEALKVFAIDMAMYRVALAFSRSTDRLEKGYQLAVDRVKGIASGKYGRLTTVSGAGAVDGESVSASPGEAIVVAPERQFTRDKMGGW